MSATKEIWILGAAGRIGRGVAVDLSARGFKLVLLGRDRARLLELAGTIGGEPRIVVAGSVEAIAAEIAQSRPAVVLNAIGPFLETALPIVRACPQGTHYVDIANELFAITALLGLHDKAVATGQCLVTGAGFGLLAAESVVMKVCEGKPPAARVRVDTVPRIDGSDIIGPTVAATVVEGFATGGRRYEDGQLVRASIGGDAEHLTMPDGSTAVTGAAPSGELEAAQRASGAPFVVAASSEAPTRPMARVVVSALAKLVTWRVLRDVLQDRLARLRLDPPAKKSEFSWARARVQWPDGDIREGWLRTSDGMVFTVKVASEVAARLASGGSRPGAYTPGALFGPELAEAAGGQFVLDRAAT
ncbi:saccharopine dehydrogenase NADP-binding domain-containing protein [Sorangium sp. So ce375]|uniref:saccharopine dehydrogenase NADP-binding domain-containing protein n=1 Tax=Sorangium sp. So ce375 TaxID=3133306 RepID=UPI003F5BC000